MCDFRSSILEHYLVVVRVQEEKSGSRFCDAQLMSYTIFAVPHATPPDVTYLRTIVMRVLTSAYETSKRCQEMNFCKT